MIETNFKHTDIGVIPHDWEVKKLGAIYSFRYGIGNTNPNNGGKYPIYGANGVIGGYSKYNAEDSIVIGHMGEYAGSVLWAEGKHFVTYNGTITRPKEENSINAKYGFYALLKLNINNICAGSGYPFLAYDKLNSLKIPLPPTLAEQEKIANALSKIDQLINDLGALIEKKKAIKQGTMQDLLTAKRRLKGFTGEWKEKQLKEICERYDNLRIPISAKLRKKGNTPYYGANGIQDYVEGYTHDGEFILIAEDGANSLTNYPIKYVIGKIWVNNHAHVITAKDEKTNNVYLSYALKCVDFESNIVGSGRAKLNADTLMQLSVVIPPTLAEQNAIANILSSMDTEIINLEQKRNKYIVIKQGMMQNLLTGKIRLI